MGDSDQKYRRVVDLSDDEYVIDVDDSIDIAAALGNLRSESIRGQYVELSPIPYVVANLHGILEEVNLATCQLLGTGAAHLVGRPLHSVMDVSPVFVERFFECLRGTLATISMETSVTPTTTFRFVGLRFDDSGSEKIRIAIVEFNPIAHRQDDARLSNVLLQANDGFLFYDKSGNLIRTNRQARSLLRNHPIEKIADLLNSVGASPDTNFESLKTSLTRTNLWKRDFESDKKNVLLRISVNAVADPDLGVDELLVTVHEVEHATPIRSESEIAVKKLGEKVRSPMGILSEALDLLKTVSTDPNSVIKLCDIASQSADAIAVAIENMIAISEGVGSLKIDPKVQSLAPILEKSVSLAFESYVDLEFETAGDVDAIVNCDAGKMVQALSNLCRVVASTAFPTGKVHLQIDHTMENVTIQISTDVNLGLGLEESSATLLGFDFDVANEIIRQHNGTVERTQNDGSSKIVIVLW